MNAPSSKHATVLVYAAGGNELEPEIWSSVRSAFHACADSSVRILIQVSRWPRALVSIVRPSLLPVSEPDQWTDTRQYLLAGGSAELISESSAVCMADPSVLYDFICRGARDYPADCYVLVLSGHACQHVGFLTDYSTSGPYIMGTESLGRAVRDACHEARISLDTLVMDVCYCNCLETIYEIAAESRCTESAPAVKSIVTHAHEGPLSGIELDLIARAATSGIRHCQCYEGFAVALTSAYKGSLVSIRTPQSSLDAARNHLERLVTECRASGLYPGSSSFADKFGACQSLNELRRVVEQMVVRTKSSTRPPYAGEMSITLSTPFEPYDYIYWHTLRLVSHTGWGKLLGRAESGSGTSRSDCGPLLLPRSALLASVRCMNPWMSENQVDRTVRISGVQSGDMRPERPSHAV